ncbi:MAG TPA: GNAT family N-acetyltransferase [Bacillus bacterium]|nr:GNAT family N-acetyltransferase [Bacillus sp. (in: firmicutes)]
MRNLLSIATIKAENDEAAFLFEVYASSRIDEVAAWGWEKEQIHQFLQMQHLCQQRSYELQYPHMETKIIFFENEKVGRLLLADFKDKLVLVDITLLSNYQNKGIGTKVLTDLLQYAGQQNKIVQLHVFSNNEKAKKLYERLGFQQVSMKDMYVQMEWSGY